MSTNMQAALSAFRQIINLSHEIKPCNVALRQIVDVANSILTDAGHTAIIMPWDTMEPHLKAYQIIGGFHSPSAITFGETGDEAKRHYNDWLHCTYGRRDDGVGVSLMNTDHVCILNGGTMNYAPGVKGAPDPQYVQDEVGRINALIQLAQDEQWADDALDDLVHDSAQEGELDKLNTIEDEEKQDEHISGVEQSASDVNNGGHAAQIKSLVEAGVTDEDIRRAGREQ